MAGAGRHAAPRRPPAVTEALQAAGVITGSLAVIVMLTVLGGGPGPAGGTSVDGFPGGSRPGAPGSSVGSGGATPTQVVGPGATGGTGIPPTWLPPTGVAPPTPGVPTGPPATGVADPTTTTVRSTTGTGATGTTTPGPVTGSTPSSTPSDHAAALGASHGAPDPGADPDQATDGTPRQAVRPSHADPERESAEPRRRRGIRLGASVLDGILAVAGPSLGRPATQLNSVGVSPLRGVIGFDIGR